MAGRRWGSGRWFGSRANRIDPDRYLADRVFRRYLLDSAERGFATQEEVTRALSAPDEDEMLPAPPASGMRVVGHESAPGEASAQKGRVGHG